MKKRIISLILIIVLITTIPCYASENNSIDISEGSISITATNNSISIIQNDSEYNIDGNTINIIQTNETTSNTIVISCDYSLNLIFNNLNVETNDTFLELSEGSSVVVTANGNNHIVSNSIISFLIPSSSDITFTGENGKFFIENNEGIAIGNERWNAYELLGEVNIKSTKMDIIGGISGKGYMNEGSVNIIGSIVSTTTKDRYPLSGDNIIITIVDSEVTAINESRDDVSTTAAGAAIGGIDSTVVIKNSNVTASAIWGAGIGSDSNYSNGKISIIDSTINAHSNEGAAIGGGCNGKGGNIYISNSDITAEGWTSVIGGGGLSNDEYGAESIVIENSNMDLTSIYGCTDQGELYNERIYFSMSKKYNTNNILITIDSNNTGLSYCWQSSTDSKNWSDLEETSSSIQKDVTQSKTYYRCKITNSFGTYIYTDPVEVYNDTSSLPEITNTIERGTEYKINYISLKDTKNYSLTNLEESKFITEISITNLSSLYMDYLVIATYDKCGKMIGMNYVYSNINMGQTLIFGYMIDNSDHNIGNIKVMMLPTFNSNSSFVPLSNTMSI